MSFQLDTSGYVGGSPLHLSVRIYWPDLDAFTQGYVEALLRDLLSRLFGPDGEGYSDAQLSAMVRFDRLAPETLATIIRDCVAWLARYPKTERTSEKGANMWRYRQEQLVERPDFPPLAPTLGDDGLVRFASGVKPPETSEDARNASHAAADRPGLGSLKTPPATNKEMEQ